MYYRKILSPDLFRWRGMGLWCLSWGIDLGRLYVKLSESFLLLCNVCPHRRCLKTLLHYTAREMCVSRAMYGIRGNYLSEVALCFYTLLISVPFETIFVLIHETRYIVRITCIKIRKYLKSFLKQNNNPGHLHTQPSAISKLNRAYDIGARD